MKEKDIEKFDEMNEKLLNITHIYTFNSSNFIFFDSFLLPFLKNHPNFVKNCIYQIINYSLLDQSCFFFTKFIKYNGIDLNHYSIETKNTTILIHAIQYKNERAIEMLLKNPKVNINEMGGLSIYPFIVACTMHCDLKVVKMFCDHPNFNVNMKCKKTNTFQILLTQGCSFALDFLIQKYPNMEKAPFAAYCNVCMKINRLVNLKIFIKYQLTIESKDEVIKHLKTAASFGGFNENYFKIFLSIVDELTK